MYWTSWFWICGSRVEWAFTNPQFSQKMSRSKEAVPEETRIVSRQQQSAETTYIAQKNEPRDHFARTRHTVRSIIRKRDQSFNRTVRMYVRCLSFSYSSSINATQHNYRNHHTECKDSVCPKDYRTLHYRLQYLQHLPNLFLHSLHIFGFETSWQSRSLILF